MVTKSQPKFERKVTLTEIRNYLNDETPICEPELRQAMALIREYGLQCLHEGYDNGKK